MNWDPLMQHATVEQHISEVTAFLRDIYRARSRLDAFCHVWDISWHRYVR